MTERDERTGERSTPAISEELASRMAAAVEAERTTKAISIQGLAFASTSSVAVIPMPDSYYDEVRKSLGHGTPTLLLGTSRRTLDHSVRELREASIPPGASKESSKPAKAASSHRLRWAIIGTLVVVAAFCGVSYGFNWSFSVVVGSLTTTTVTAVVGLVYAVTKFHKVKIEHGAPVWSSKHPESTGKEQKKKDI